MNNNELKVGDLVIVNQFSDKPIGIIIKKTKNKLFNIIVLIGDKECYSFKDNTLKRVG